VFSTGEIAGGMVMKAGGSAVKEPAAAISRHVKITNPTAESSLRQRKVRMWGLRFELKSGLVTDLAIFMALFVSVRQFSRQERTKLLYLDRNLLYLGSS
jgi:hypothetical protein